MLKKIPKIGAALATTITSLLLGASQASAASYDYSTDLGGAFGSTACLGGNIIVTICCGLFSLVFTAFTIWMIIDVVQRDEKVLPGKIKWLLIILLVPFGAVVYYFMRKRQMDAIGKSTPVAKTE